jgi:hypothetical protein
MANPEKNIDLINESDRGAVIVAAALLENDLTERLNKEIKKSGMSTRQLKEAFDMSGPLSSFSSKALICYAFCLITKNDFDDLAKIRKLRNKFAHSANHVSFMSPEIKEIIQSLNCCIEASKYYEGEVFQSYSTSSERPNDAPEIHEWDLRAKGLITVTKSLFSVGVMTLRDRIKFGLS